MSMKKIREGKVYDGDESEDEAMKEGHNKD